ncbi:MAG: tyrosine-type recombinase/integrase [Pirellulales bacterium]|nr:tyrosine-type recombinase/integrase [Pirellulales bacterium]
MKGVSVRANKARDYFVPREDAAKVLDACPDAQWRLLFALSRYGGLRCPSETLALRWADVDLAAGRMVVRSPKTEHIDGKESRVVPIFPELRPYLEDAEALAAEGAEFVISRYRDSNSNLRTQLNRIIERAGLKPWPKLFQNLRATRATELVAQHPSHVAAEWLGHSTLVAQKHYWRTTDADFDKATTSPGKALHEAVQSAAVSSGHETSGDPLDSENAELCGVSSDREYARQDSNLRPTD